MTAAPSRNGAARRANWRFLANPGCSVNALSGTSQWRRPSSWPAEDLEHLRPMRAAPKLPVLMTFQRHLRLPGEQVVLAIWSLERLLGMGWRQSLCWMHRGYLSSFQKQKECLTRIRLRAHRPRSRKPAWSLECLGLVHAQRTQRRKEGKTHQRTNYKEKPLHSRGPGLQATGSTEKRPMLAESGGLFPTPPSH